jgi:hypothetical protein
MSLLDGYEEQNKRSSLLDGYEEKTTRTSLLDGYQATSKPVAKKTPNRTKPQGIKYFPDGSVDTEHFKKNIDAIYDIPNAEIPKSSTLVNSDGQVKQNRTIEDRFENRNSNFIENAKKDAQDAIGGLAQLVGGVTNFAITRPVMNVILGDKEKSIKEKLFTGEGIEDLQNLKNVLPAVKEGFKENYGQKGVDIINFERMQKGESPIKLDLEGLGQSYYAHPLNLLDLVGVGEIGKIKPIANATKGGQVSDFAKTVGNKTVSPKYSENLLINAGQRALETKPVQNLVKAIDESPMRPTTDVVADFLGLNPDSRLLGAKGAEVRQAKLIEQANQVKNIAERNKAIAENQALLSGLNDVEAKELIKSIESGTPIENITPQMQDVRNVLRDKVTKNADFYTSRGLLSKEAVQELPVNTYASIKYNKPIDSLSDVEKLEALKDIDKMPVEQQPFYVPMMFDDKLRAGDFFASSTKRYKSPELKHRSVGMGLETNKTGGKRVYDPVELANRLDAHRIKMVNTENMINELIDNFAKPLDLSKDKVLDGYVPFNPDAFMKFYKKSIDLNEAALSKIGDLDNVDDVIKASVQKAIEELPDDIIEVMGAFKNNKIYQIPQGVAESLMQGKNKKGIWEMMFDMGTAGFKRKVLGLSPKWFINNRIGNGIMAGLKGVLPQDYIKAFNVSEDLLPEALRTKSMYEAEKTIIGRTGGGNNSTFGNITRLLGGEFIDTSELKGLQKAGATAANALGVPGKVMNNLTDAMFAFNQKFEALERKSAYLHSVDTVGRKMLKTAGQNIVKQDELLKGVLDNPEILDAVIKDVDNTLGDYINMTATERRVIRKVVPFYSWMRTITRYTLSLPESNPFRAGLAEKLNRVLHEEDESLPEYQQGSIATKFKSERTGKPLRLNYEHSIPFSTFGETVDNPVGLINPLFTLGLEAAQGQKMFMNRPLTSKNYENVFPRGYASLKAENAGEYIDTLPAFERLKSLPIGYARATVPGLEWVERVGAGTIQNLLNGEGFVPKDALYDTSFGGYNYNEGFNKKPKGWSNEEQLLRLLFPIQQEGQVKKKVKIKRDVIE